MQRCAMQVRHHRFDDIPFAADRDGRESKYGTSRSGEDLSEIWLGSMRGSKRFILTGILASAGLFLVGWIGFLWLLIWIFPAVF